ncbi:UDP-N-acetylmuramoyl-tripeptide--D-alanyl-D-alanine ligase [Salinimicrobium catena]|uniref:UDP-N-acetylmuramoyl-tripeptide--D-alanyl-D- alanine ligase n=1 Tax=Salinimicrobium catena TaxID=390640 RepID=UPI002FE4EDE2
MKIEDLHKLFLESKGVSTDTRKIKEGSMFFALKGENFNANEFAEQALQKGAKYAIIDEEKYSRGENFILVKNVLKALQELASFHRNYLGIPIIGLTGSNGKTTTKELINAALSKKYKTTATSGNLNNHIGVPLTLLSMNKQTEIGIVEMGANHRKEIAFLCQIAQPDYGYITNFGKAHLEGFGGVEGVIKGKSELYEYLKANEKTIFLNLDDPIQKKHLSYQKIYSFGSDEKPDVPVEYLQGGNFAAIRVAGYEINSKMIGSYNGKNMAAAYTIADYFKVAPEEIKKALENYIPGNNRSQVINRENLTIILDAYNANPTSMAAAIENLEAMPQRPKTVILGDMFEMGESSKAEHQELAERLQKGSIDSVYIIGKAFYGTSTDSRIKKYRTFEDFTADYSSGSIDNGVVLIKGSRGMALERALEFI